MSAVIPERWAIRHDMAKGLQAGRRGLINEFRQCIEELGTAEAALQAMTIDRDLWRDAHDEDCPNQAMLESTEAALSQAQEQVVRLKELVATLWKHGSFSQSVGNALSEDSVLRAALADTPDQKEQP